jgi:hypothetical protein
MRKTVLMAGLICAIIGFDAYIIVQYLSAQRVDDSEIAAMPVEFDDESYLEMDEGIVYLTEELQNGGEHFAPLRFAYDLPGVDNPKLLDSDEAQIADETKVVGVEINNEAYAFSLGTMNAETHHIVNCLRGETPFTVTYCPMADCVRVLTREDPELIPLRLGGLNDQDMMVVLLEGIRYDQNSTGLPLKDHAYSRTTFGEWKKLHPQTKVFNERSIPKSIRSKQQQLRS